MPFSRDEILQAFVDAALLGRPMRDTLEAIADERERVLEASRQRAALWRANPANREKKRRYMRVYSAEPESKARAKVRNQSPEAKAYQRERWQEPETKRRRNERRRKQRAK